MKSLVLGLLLLSLAHCGGAEQMDSKDTKDKVTTFEKGRNIQFFCEDERLKRVLKIDAIWGTITRQWRINLTETDGANSISFQKFGLRGKKDEFLDVIHISNNNEPFAVLRQIDRSLAQYRDGNRILECEF